MTNEHQENIKNSLAKIDEQLAKIKSELARIASNGDQIAEWEIEGIVSDISKLGREIARY
jgi:hypothetical protein